MRALLGNLLASALIVGLLGVLWAVVRFSILSPARLRGSRARLRLPSAREVSSWSGVPIPAALEAAFLRDPRIERSDFALVDPAAAPPRRWEIGNFIPLAVRDASEWQKISGGSGVPIATDLDKGVYFLKLDGSIALVGRGRAEVMVAGTVEEFLAFNAQEALEA